MSIDQLLLLPPGYGFDNAKPSIVVPSAQNAVSNVALAITGTSLSDADGNTQTVTLTVSHGTLTLASTTGLTFTAGDGTADTTMTFSGSVANVNTAIATLTYTSTTDYEGADSLAISTNDGAGGTDSDSVAITVTFTALSLGASLVEWYDGTARIYSDAGTTAAVEGNSVEQWTGYSGGVLSEPTPANQLTYHVGANSEGYVQGDSTESIIGTFAGGSTAFSACEVWITFKRPGNMGAGEAAQISRASDNVPLLQFSRIANTTICGIARNNASTLVQTTTTTISDTSWQTLRISWDGANASLYKDNVLVESKALTGTLTMDKFSVLGNIAGAGKLAAQVAQALICNAALSSGKASGLQTYLASRYPI